MAGLSELEISKDFDGSPESIQESRVRMARYRKPYHQNFQNPAKGLNRQMRSFDEQVRQLLRHISRNHFALCEPLGPIVAKFGKLVRHSPQRIQAINLQRNISRRRTRMQEIESQATTK